MKFDHYSPCDALKPFIQSFVISEAEEENTYKVLPSLNLVIGFPYRGGLRAIHKGQPTDLSNYGITGLKK